MSKQPHRCLFRMRRESLMAVQAMQRLVLGLYEKHILDYEVDQRQVIAVTVFDREFTGGHCTKLIFNETIWPATEQGSYGNLMRVSFQPRKSHEELYIFEVDISRGIHHCVRNVGLEPEPGGFFNIFDTPFRGMLVTEADNPQESDGG